MLLPLKTEVLTPGKCLNEIAWYEMMINYSRDSWRNQVYAAERREYWGKRVAYYRRCFIRLIAQQGGQAC